MTTMPILFWWPTLAIGLLIVIIFVYRSKTSRFNRLINQIPGYGPYFQLVHGLPYILSKREGRFSKTKAQVKPYEKYDIFRMRIAFSPQILILKAPAVEAVLGNARQIEKTDFYKSLHPWLETGLLTSSGDKWRSHRKLITPSFHFRILEDFIGVFNEQADILVNILRQFEGKGQFDIHPYLSRCTLGVIVESAMGVKTIKAQTDANSKFVMAIRKMTEIVFYRALFPWLSPDIIFNLSSNGRTHSKCLKIIHGLTRQVIKEKRAEHLEGKTSEVEKDDEVGVYGRKRRLAFLDLLLESTCDGQKLTDREIAQEVDTFMFAGHDTTATAAVWTLYNIGRLPDIQAMVHQELDEIFGDSNRPILSEDFHKMKFLECVIKESMRLFPPVPIFSRKLTEDTQIGEYLLPAGVNAILLVYWIHRDPNNFPDPEKFDPDRFLPENSANRHPYAYVPFCAGSRNCIGQRFAMMEEKVIIAKVLRHFRIASMQKLEDLILLTELVLKPFNGMWMKLESRNKNII